MPVELKRGAVLGNYQLLVKIGQGGMASVWVARDGSPGGVDRLVALKAMHGELSDDPKFRSMFLDEVGLVRSIEHENVVKLYSTDDHDGCLYMAMEWVEGDSLRQVINEAKKRRPIPPEIAVRIIADAAAGLHAAHELVGWDGELRGVVHCDVSPHNILCGIDGTVKLVDFGVANAKSQIDEGEEVKGKFGYMSPEQARAEPIDRRSDVFSLGIVLFELTTGYRLFLGRDNSHTLELVKWGRLPKPTDIIPDYPLRLEEIVMRALARDVDERFQTADDLREALERYLVEDRIHVTRAGVASLVKRVLGERIERIRHAVRTALIHIDGVAPGADLVPAEPVLDAHRLEDLSVVDEEVSLSRIEITPSGATGVAESPSSRPPPPADEGEAHAPSPPPSPVLSSFPPPPRLPSSPSSGAKPAGTLWFALIAVTAAIAALAIVLASNDPSPEGGAVAVAPSKAAVGPSATPLPAHGRVRAASDTAAIGVESLPMDEPNTKPTDHEARGTEHRDPNRQKGVEALDSRNRGPNPEAPATTPPPTPAAAGAPNRGAMLAALGSASGSASGCKRKDGPTGSGRASVTFGPSGAVTGVNVSGPFGGTPVGNCVAGAFRSARVPPFTGSPVTLGSGFSVGR